MNFWTGLSEDWSSWFSWALFPYIFKIQIKEEYSNGQNNNSHFERTSIQKFRPLSKNRPGRKAKLADSELSPAELEKREVRRVRNKQAARRCRQRRLEKTYNLEQKVSFSQLIEGIVEKLVNSSVPAFRYRIDNSTWLYNFDFHGETHTKWNRTSRIFIVIYRSKSTSSSSFQ